MKLPYSIEMRVRNRRRNTVQIGNRLVQGSSYELVEFATREELLKALRLKENGNIQFLAEIPGEILTFLEDSMRMPIMPVVPVSPVQPYSVPVRPYAIPVPSNSESVIVDYKDLLNKPVIPTKVSQLTNDENFVRSTEAFNGNYGDLQNKPLIPSKTSDLKNDSQWVRSASAERIEIVTQAEYDALPATKNTDNVLYLLKGDA